MREKDKVNDEREREKKNEREWEVSCFLFLFYNKGYFRKIKCFISLFSICRLSLGVGFKYETYEDLLSIFGLSWAQNKILPIIYFKIMIPQVWLISYNKYFIVILYIYNILSINVLQINLLLRINGNKWVKISEDKY